MMIIISRRFESRVLPRESQKMMDSRGKLKKVFVSYKGLGAKTGQWCCAERMKTESKVLKTLVAMVYEDECTQCLGALSCTISLEDFAAAPAVAEHIVDYLRGDMTWWQSSLVSLGALDFAHMLDFHRLVGAIANPINVEKWKKGHPAYQ